jgi:hypothetical protein
MASLQTVSSEDLRAELARRAAREDAAKAAEARAKQGSGGGNGVFSPVTEEIPMARVPVPFLQQKRLLEDTEWTTAAGTSVASFPTKYSKGDDGGSQAETMTVVYSDIASSSSADRSSLSSQQLLELVLQKKKIKVDDGAELAGDLSDGPASENETTTSSKRSSARAAKDRGPRRRERDLRRAQAKREADGQAKLPAGALREEGLFRATGLRGTEAAAAQAAIVGAAVQLSQEERKRRFAEMMIGDDTVASSISEAVRAILPSVRWTLHDGRCHLCDRMSDDAHCGTSRHQERMKVSAGVTMLCGPSAMPHGRPVYRGLSCRRMTQFLANFYWGEGCGLMHLVASNVLKHHKVVKFSTQSGKTYDLPANEIEPAFTGLVSYMASDGKYKWGREKMIPFADLPQGGPWDLEEEDKDEEDAWSLSTTGPDTRRQEIDGQWWPITTWRAKSNASPSTKELLLATAGGWWATCV